MTMGKQRDSKATENYHHVNWQLLSFKQLFSWISSHFVAVRLQHQCFGSLSLVPKCCFQLQQAAAIIENVTFFLSLFLPNYQFVSFGCYC